MNLIDQVKTHRRIIKHETLTMALSELVNMYEILPKEINISPEFQRLFRWSREQQSNFIESLILEIPIPPLFFFEREDGIWELLDGLQRLSTIIRFFSNNTIPEEYRGISKNGDDWHEWNSNNIEAPLQLAPGEYLSALAGHTYQTLPVQLQLNLKRVRLQVTVLKRETDPIYKYAVFERLNKGGSQIEPQEIRNCSVRILSQKFPDFVQRLAKNENFLSGVNPSQNNLRNGYVEELVLRFFAVKNWASEFRHDVDQFLTRFMEEVAKGTVPFDYDKEENIFNQTWEIIKLAADQGHAFRAKNVEDKSIGPFSPALYEMITYGISSNLHKLDPNDNLSDRIIDAIKRAKDQGLTGAGSNSKRKFNDRLKFGREAFE